MSKINYYLKNAPNADYLQLLKKENRKLYNEELDTRRPIIMSVAYDSKREIFSTGKFITLRFWDRVAMRIKNLSETPIESITDGEWLDAKKLEVEKYIKIARSEYRSFSRNELYELILKKVRNKISVNTLKEILMQFFSEHKTKRGASIKVNTMRKYSCLVKHIEGFQGHDQFIPELYSTAWAKKFKTYLMVDLESENHLRCNNNSVSKYITALATFFTHLKINGHKIPAEISELKVAETEQIVNVLQIDELRILEQMEFDNYFHSQVRDVFLFQCYTGARYSDIEKINREDIKQDGEMKIWDFIAEKTGQQIIVPLSPNAITIIEKYKDLPTPLPKYTNQAINRELKIIAEQAKFNRKVKKISYHDNRKLEYSYCLHQVISTHMARKTFISLSLQLGVPERMVREISGHRDERSFRRYVNLNKSHLVAVANAWKSMLN
jgi:integrase